MLPPGGQLPLGVAYDPTPRVLSPRPDRLSCSGARSGPPQIRSVYRVPCAFRHLLSVFFYSLIALETPVS